MAEFSANAIQTVVQNGAVTFTDAPVPCERGFVRHRDDSGNFLLSGWTPNRCGCCCGRRREATYLVDFGANISIPEGGTVGEISLALAIDGTIIPSSQMVVTPAAVDEAFNVSRAINVQVWNGCCENVSVVNTSTQAIQVENANIIFTRPDLLMSR